MHRASASVGHLFGPALAGPFLRSHGMGAVRGRPDTEAARLVEDSLPAVGVQVRAESILLLHAQPVCELPTLVAPVPVDEVQYESDPRYVWRSKCILTKHEFRGLEIIYFVLNVLVQIDYAIIDHNIYVIPYYCRNHIGDKVGK